MPRAGRRRKKRRIPKDAWCHDGPPGVPGPAARNRQGQLEAGPHRRMKRRRSPKPTPRKMQMSQRGIQLRSRRSAWCRDGPRNGRGHRQSPGSARHARKRETSSRIKLEMRLKKPRNRRKLLLRELSLLSRPTTVNPLRSLQRRQRLHHPILQRQRPRKPRLTGRRSLPPEALHRNTAEREGAVSPAGRTTVGEALKAGSGLSGSHSPSWKS